MMRAETWRFKGVSAGIDVDLIRCVDTGESGGFLELRGIETGIDDNVVGASPVETFLAAGGIRDGDHIESAALAITRFVAAEIASGEREKIVAHEEVLHPGISDDIIVIFEYDVVGIGAGG